MPQLARWLTFIEQFDYEIEHRPGVKHGNANGLSRRATPTVQVLNIKGPDKAAPVAETMAEWQLRDAEIGTFVSLQLNQGHPPEKAEIQSESELTKQLVSNWDNSRSTMAWCIDGIMIRPKERAIICSYCSLEQMYLKQSDYAMVV